MNGFAVVRLPNLNYVDERRQACPVIGDVYYSGIKRLPWTDVFDEDFYRHRMPEKIRDLTVGITSKDFSGIDLCQNLRAAQELLHYSNRNSVANELVVVRSDALNVVKGCIEVEQSVEWMGFDFVALGEWSLIEAGLFRHQDYYENWLPLVNRFGLFDDPLLLSDYVATYQEAAAIAKSEPIAPSGEGFGQLAIEVGRLCS